MRCAVVGHVEWVEFARVPRMPSAGEIVHAERIWKEPAGGGAVVARQLALLAGRCELFTALGDDALGRESAARLAELGIDVHVKWGGATRRAWTHVDGAGGAHDHRALGDKLLPVGPLPLDGYDLGLLRRRRAERAPNRRDARASSPEPCESCRRCGHAERRSSTCSSRSANDPGER